MRWNWVADDRYAGGSACVLPLVGFDEFALADKITPPVTVVAQDPAAMGAAAAQLLFARIAGDTSPARELIFKPQLLIRGSGEIPPERAAERRERQR